MRNTLNIQILLKNENVQYIGVGWWSMSNMNHETILIYAILKHTHINMISYVTLYPKLQQLHFDVDDHFFNIIITPFVMLQCW